MDQLYFIDNSLSNSITVELHLFVWVNVRGSSNFAGSWGRNFVGNWFVALQDMTIHYFVKPSWGHKFRGRCNQRNPRTLIPHEHWWIHSTCILTYSNLNLYKIFFGTRSYNELREKKGPSTHWLLYIPWK